jgi:hypothetical protein
MQWCGDGVGHKKMQVKSFTAGHMFPCGAYVQVLQQPARQLEIEVHSCSLKRIKKGLPAHGKGCPAYQSLAAAAQSPMALLLLLPAVLLLRRLPLSSAQLQLPLLA